MSTAKIIRYAAKKQDISVQSHEDYDEILQNYEKLADELSEIDMKISMSENNRQIRSAVIAASTDFDDVDIDAICSVLFNKYKYVESIDKLKAGKYIRWVNRRGKLSIARFCNIKPTEIGINVLCITGISKFITYKFNETMTFQELTDEEKIILWLNDDTDIKNLIK